LCTSTTFHHHFIHAARVHHFHRITANAIEEWFHLFAPSGIHAHGHREFVHFGQAGHRIIFGHHHDHVDAIASHCVAGAKAADHLHTARRAETFHEFLHEHFRFFHGHTRHRFQGATHDDQIAFLIGHHDRHNRARFHHRASDLIDAFIAHGDHVSVFGIHADVHLTFHSGSGVGEFHHHHEHGRAAEAHLPLTHAFGAVFLPHHHALMEGFFPHIAAIGFDFVHAHHIAFHHIGVHRAGHF